MITYEAPPALLKLATRLRFLSRSGNGRHASAPADHDGAALDGRETERLVRERLYAPPRTGRLETRPVRPRPK